MARRFDAVLFDAGGVLVLPDPNVIGPLLRPYGGAIEIDRHRRAHYAGMSRKSNVGSIESEWGDYDLAYVESVGVDPDLVVHAAEVLGHTRSAHLWRWPIPESLEGLRGLAAIGIPMGVVSNASGQIETVLRLSGVCQRGDGPGVEMRVIVDSHVAGVAKPDPAIFDHALPGFLDFERDRIVYVGDSVTMDVASAHAAGLHPVLLDPFDDHRGADFDRVASVADIVDWF